jgi:putative hydrolase of HD superfamily
LDNERLLKQIEFIVEIDKVKQVFRQNVVIGTSRNENDAEHSWHLAVMAILLSEYAVEKEIDVLRVVKMVLIHDLVEIDAGDTFCYDEKGYEDKEEREQRAAKRLFNILPSDQAQEIRELWREFEELKTPEARFAACLDRIQPLILNYNTNGHTWKKPGVTSEKVLKRNELLQENAPLLWEYVRQVIEDSIQKGYLKR